LRRVYRYGLDAIGYFFFVMPGLFCRETEVGARTGSGGCGLIARDAGIVAIAVDVYIVLVFGFFSFFCRPG
jgi:hypothetical protein